MPKAGRRVQEERGRRGWDWRILGGLEAPARDDEGAHRHRSFSRWTGRVGQEGFMTSVKRRRGDFSRRRQKGSRRRRTQRLRFVNSWSFGKKRRQVNLGKGCGRIPFGREKTLLVVRERRSDRWTAHGGAHLLSLAHPRPSCRSLSRNSLLSVEEAVRVHPDPGSAAIPDWAQGAPAHARSGWMHGPCQPIISALDAAGRG